MEDEQRSAATELALGPRLTQVVERLRKREILLMTLLLALSLIVLGLVARRIDAFWPKIPFVLFAGWRIYRLGSVLRAKRDGDDKTVAWFAVGFAVVGALAIGSYVFFDAVAWSWILLTGLALLSIGFGAGESLIRKRVGMNPRYAIVAAAVSATLIIVGIGASWFTDSILPIIVFLISALAAYTSMMLGAEPWFAEQRWPKEAWIGFGLIVLVTVFGLFSLVWWAPILAVLAVFLTWLIVVDADPLFALLVVIFALLWALVPRDAPSPTIDQEIATGDNLLIAMGDSYMSGEGAERYELGTNIRGENICRRSAESWSALFGKLPPANPDTSASFTTVSIACSGADVIDIDHTNVPGTEARASSGDAPVDQLDELQAILKKLEAADAVDRVKYVTLSVGGNDAGFAQIGATCAGMGDCDEQREVWLRRIEDTKPRLVQLYQDLDRVLDDAGSDAPILVVGYPLPLTPDGCWWTWLSEDEHRFVIDFIEQLNWTIASAVQDAAEVTGGDRVFFMDTHETAMQSNISGEDLRLCEDGFWSGGVNFIELNPMGGSLAASLDPRNWINNTFHPNERGHQAFLGEVGGWLSTFDPNASRPPVGDPPHAAASHSAQGDEGTCFAVTDPKTGTSCDDEIAGWARAELIDTLRWTAIPAALLFFGAFLVVTSWVRDRRGPVVDRLKPFQNKVAPRFRTFTKRRSR